LVLILGLLGLKESLAGAGFFLSFFAAAAAAAAADAGVVWAAAVVVLGSVDVDVE
jgi:hypothetical protein